MRLVVMLALLCGLCGAAEERWTVVAEGKAVQPYEVKSLKVALCQKPGDKAIYCVIKVAFVHYQGVTYDIAITAETTWNGTLKGTEMVNAVPHGKLANATIAIPTEIQPDATGIQVFSSGQRLVTFTFKKFAVLK